MELGGAAGNDNVPSSTSNGASFRHGACDGLVTLNQEKVGRIWFGDGKRTKSNVSICTVYYRRPKLLERRDRDASLSRRKWNEKKDAYTNQADNKDERCSHCAFRR